MIHMYVMDFKSMYSVKRAKKEEFISGTYVDICTIDAHST